MIVQAAEELKQSQQHMLKQQRQQPEPEPMRKLQPQQELQQQPRQGPGTSLTSGESATTTLSFSAFRCVSAVLIAHGSLPFDR